MDHPGIVQLFHEIGNRRTLSISLCKKKLTWHLCKLDHSRLFTTLYRSCVVFDQHQQELMSIKHKMSVQMCAIQTFICHHKI